MLSTYFLEVSTGAAYGVEEYDAAAGRLVNALVEILSDTENINMLTGNAERASCHSEVEVNLSNGELAAKVVVDIAAEAPVKFDKAKWTKMLKTTAYEWKKIKTNKRQVPNVQDSFLES